MAILKVKKLIFSGNLGQKSFIGLLLKVISLILNFTISIVLAQFLGAENYGNYIYFLSWVNVAVTVVSLGQNQLALRLISRTSKDEDNKKTHEVLVNTSLVVLLSSFAAIFIIAIIYYFLNYFFSESIYSLYVFVIIYFLLIFKTYTAYFQCVLRGFHKVILGQLPELIVSPFIFLMILCVLVYGYKIKEFSVYLLILSCSYLFALIFCLVALCRLIDFKKLFQSISVNSRKYSALGVPFLWLNVLSVGTREMDAIMLGLLGEMSDVGVYGVVQRGVRLITFAEASVTMAVAASFSYSYSKSDLVELQRQYIQASVIIFCFSAPILLGLIFFSRFYLSLFGDNFQVGVVPLIIMLLAHVIHLFVGPALVLLNMTNGVLEVVRILICILIIKLVLNFILIPEFGLYGVSISYFLAVLTSYILAAIVISKKLNVNAFITFLFLSRKNDEK